MSRESEIRREVELPATPEEVWEAIATGPGNATWLFPNEIEPGLGAKSRDGATTTTAWDPPRHFAVRTEGEGGWFNALEFVIEAREGGTAVLRYVHSGIFVDDWDNQYDAANQHTDFYLHTLGQYLQHFNGRRVTYVGGGPGGIQGPDASAGPGGFDGLRRALGVDDGVAEGDTVRVEPDGLQPFEGVVDYLRPNFVGIRSGNALYRFFGRNAFGMPVGMSIHLFENVADAESIERRWKAWLDHTLS